MTVGGLGRGSSEDPKQANNRENTRRSGRMNKNNYLFFLTLPTDARRLECLLYFLILTNQAGQRPPKSLKDTTFLL